MSVEGLRQPGAMGAEPGAPLPSEPLGSPPPGPGAPALREPLLAAEEDLQAVARGERTLGLGARGTAVASLQRALRRLGYGQGPAESGQIYGRSLERLVAAFQRRHGLEPTGAVDRATLFAIEAALLQLPAETARDATTGGRSLSPREVQPSRLPGLPGPPGFLRGDLVVERPADLARLEGVTVLDGSLTIRGPHLRASDLEPLRSLTAITGDLAVAGTLELSDLDALSGVSQLGGSLWINGNASLRSLAGLAQLRVGGALVSLTNNASLESSAAQPLVEALAANGFRGAFDLPPGVHAPPAGSAPAASPAPAPGPATAPPAGSPPAGAAPAGEDRAAAGAGAAAATSSVSAPQAVDPRLIRPADWTFFIYLNADNSLDSYGPADLNEAELVGSIPGKVNVFALVDPGYSAGRAGWPAEPCLLLIQKDPEGSEQVRGLQVRIDPDSRLGKLLAESRGALNMGDPRVLRAAIEFLRERVPSQRFLLDLWDHGAGWRGASFDDRPHDALTLHDGELKAALSGLKVDIISADACYMASAEMAGLAEELEASFLVASEDYEPGPGWNYGKVMRNVERLFEEHAEVTADALARAIVDAYEGEGNTLSAIDIKRLVVVRAQLEALGVVLMTAGGLHGNPAIRRCYESARRFGGDRMDLGDFAARLAQTFPPGPLQEAAERLRAAIAEVSYTRNATGFEQATGLTIHAPTSALDPLYTHPAAPWRDGRWVDFVATATAPPDPDFPIPPWAQPVPAPAEPAAEGAASSGGGPPP
ncbi:MAG: hypothetical protein KatS3mg102_2619 [Planctomycetota bacterium]|nr:MAG: hypothetical protein KatS3mg102_2619 [Planctomycetota bacterium]